MIEEMTSFYVDFERLPVIFTFIRDEKFIKILVDDDNIIIIIEIKNLKKYSLLYQLYILSLLCKNNDESKICCINRNFIYNNYDYIYRKYDFIKLHKDLLILAFTYNSTKYPIKETSNEEIIKSEGRIKFYFNDDINTNPLKVINDFILKSIEESNIKKVIEYEKRINILTSIRAMNRDIYSNILHLLPFKMSDL